MKLPENTGINKYIIKLIKDKQLLYGIIYAFSIVELVTLKTYIETYLKTGFIWPSNSSADIPIFSDKKLNCNLCLYINLKGLNNLAIIN